MDGWEVCEWVYRLIAKQTERLEDADWQGD